MTKPHIEIVTHCYSGDAVPVYHRLLQLQLSSILTSASPALPVSVAVCYSIRDRRTVNTLSFFKKLFDTDPFVQMRLLNLPQEQLFRRAHGRNLAATTTKAEVVWFTDCDYVFLDNCLIDAWGKSGTHKFADGTEMVFPKVVNIHRSHLLGDQLVGRQLFARTYQIDPTEFAPRCERRAWGGMQIVRGDWCRENGYLKGTKWMDPVDPADGFQQCRGDVPFRKAVGPSTAVDIPGVYRVRHSRAGRDGGAKDHGEKTR